MVSRLVKALEATVLLLRWAMGRGGAFYPVNDTNVCKDFLWGIIAHEPGCRPQKRLRLDYV